MQVYRTRHVHVGLNGVEMAKMTFSPFGQDGGATESMAERAAQAKSMMLFYLLSYWYHTIIIDGMQDLELVPKQLEEPYTCKRVHCWVWNWLV